ncbi:MAG TPA: tetratricopeptide repeat protein [Pyrinomonadaceae bacterium]|nr:tetratricopeptide repeat protein [Pyrinomonadaceae bacterium]
MSVRSLARIAVRLLLLSFISVASYSATGAQTPDGLAEMKDKASALLKQTNYVEAVPLLEKIVLAEPNNAQAHYFLGSALLGQAANTKDETQRKALRMRSRSEFIRSKELGITEPNIDAMIQSLPLDGSDAPAFSSNTPANALMDEGEALFSQGKLDEALKKYQKALELDPKLYHAALFCGDVFMQKGDFAQAEVWYQKAIGIDPNRETAYRYSATPLMKQGKTEAARERYVEAFITEPYNRFARAGLIQWAQATNTNLAHPKIDIPTNVTFDEKGNAKIDLDASALAGTKDDGSFAWISYGMTRSLWRKEKFAKTFPNERVYRHSLLEEADALRSVVSLATTDKKTKTLSPSLARLKKLNDAGLLEAYVLLALADQGISRDHPAYLKDGRAKLRQYVNEYVLKGGGD